jgi:hypothetical protein
MCYLFITRRRARIRFSKLSLDTSAKTGGNNTSSTRKLSWLAWLLIILFPMPFHPWWATVTCLVLFAGLMYVLTYE